MGLRPALEPALLAMLDADEAQHRPSTENLSVTVKFTGPVADLEVVGFKAWTVIPHPDNGPSIAAGPIPLNRLGDLADVPGVLYVEGSRPLRAELKDTVPEIQANLVHSGNPSRKGAGVVVGIIDTGIDINHRTFRNPDGTTRVRGIWDQTLPPAAGERAPTAFPGLGVEYSQADVDATLRNTDDSVPFPAGSVKVRTVDRDGHGTHVAGIAAGDGSQNGNCRGEGVYVGVAPLADLLIVKVTSAITGIGQSTNLLHAFDWIWNHSAVVGDATATPPVPPQPVVVNLSRGDNRGPHDGNSLVESGLDLFLLTHPGHAVVKSAGNEGATNRHAQVVVPPNGFRDVTFDVTVNDTRDRHIEMWFSRDHRLTVTLLGPVPTGGGARPSSDPIGPNATSTPPFVPNGRAPAARQVTAMITSRVDDPRNGACVIEIDLTTNPTLPMATLLDGEWQIHLQNSFNDSVTVDLYIDNGDNAPKFTSDATRAGTITTPGTAKMVATVGAYSPQASFLFFDWSGELTDFSSFGPTRDGAPKPDVCAPGSKVTSAKTKTRQHCCCNCCFDFYTDTTEGGHEFQGTSMAAPHVAGTIALMFERDPALHVLDVLRILRDTAREPEVSHGLLPDTQWGGGRLNALGSVNGVGAPVPIPGSPPSGPVVVPSPGPSNGGGGPILRIGLSPRLAATTTLEAVGRLNAVTIGDSEAPRSTASSAPGAAVLQTPLGHYWAALVSRHFSEVRGLINHNRYVATCWHRMDGPSLFRTLASAMAGMGVLTIRDDPGILAAWRPRAARFLDMLERFGSSELRADVSTHRQLLLTLEVDDVRSLVFPQSVA